MTRISSLHEVLAWSITAAAIAGVLFRPKQWPEAVWAVLGALALVLTGVLPVRVAGAAVAKGTDVYLFLTGMMLLSELAQREGVFDWLATHAVAAARGSRARLFGLVYLVGIVVTVFLSNDATAVVLTPAVYAAVKRARAEPLPYLLVCAFIANAASFVLPISNPANLVVYGRNLPPLLAWLHEFLLPSVVSIAITFFVLRFNVRREIAGGIADGSAAVRLSGEGKLAAWAIGATGLVLIAASAFGLDLGLPTFLAAALAVVLTTRGGLGAIAQIARGVSWSILPLVAGLFVLVEALNQAGAGSDLGAAFAFCAGLPHWAGSTVAAFGIAGLSNIMNNLPSGLLAGGAVQSFHVAPHLRDAVMIGVDLGPNLSVTGSLATILWLIALRREGEHVSAWRFLKIGALVMPPALLAAALAGALFRL